jgi:long-chain acyl-CoA synthetase
MPGMSEIETLVDLFETSCQARGDAPLFGTKTDGGFSWVSYADVHCRVAEIRSLLRQLRIVKRDRVALIASNSVDWAAICYATAGSGAVTVPMYTAQSRADWEFILKDCGAKVAFVDSTKEAAPLAEIRFRLPELKHVIVLDGADSEPSSLREYLKRLDGRTVPIVRPEPTDSAGFIYTSGTTGHPKGVVLSHRNIVSNVLAAASTFPLSPADCSLSFLPWAHALGQTVDLHLLLHVGCQIGINGELSGLLSNLSLVKPTILIAVPRVFCRVYEGVRRQIDERPRAVRTLFEKGIAAATRKSQGQPQALVDRLWLMAAERLIFSRVRQRFGGNLRFAISGSAALNRDVAEFVNALGIEVYEGYGLTEASPVVSVNTPEHRRFGTVGKPIPGVTVTIDPSVEEDPSVGEIIVSGPNVMQGYHGAPEDTARVLMPDGRLRTGDMGRLDDDGYLIITGRIKEQYKLQNGKYVVPTPIEEQIKLSPLISNCLLYGADKPYCVLMVVPNPSVLRAEALSRGFDCSDVESNSNVYALLKQEVASRLRGLHSYMRPKKLLVVSEDFTVENGFLTPSLKVRRQEVIQKYAGQLAKVYDDSHAD